MPPSALTPPTLSEQARALARRWFWLPGLIGVCLALTAAWVSGWPAPIIAEDLAQTLVNAAAPIPDGPLSVRQTFRPRHAGLTAVELLVVRHEGSTPAEDAELSLTLSNAAGAIVAAQSWPAERLQHNQTLTLDFPARLDSTETPYTLHLRGFHNTAVTVWGYDRDVYADGACTADSQPTTVADLRFITRYRLTPALALAQLEELAGRHGPTLLLALAYLALPGGLWLALTGRQSGAWDLAARWGIALALGAAGWPLLWYWLTLVGGRWSRPLLWGVLIVGWSVVIGLRWRRRSSWRPVVLSRRSLLALLPLLFVALGVRWLAVRDLATLPWVDASRHALITAIMTERGQMITDYRPWLPIDQFPYHAGFHTLPAGLLTLVHWPLAAVLLSLGPALNALAPLAVYSAAWFLTRRPAVGWLAAFLVALPFFFPAYYNSWGRLTQLTGMLILPGLMGLSWEMLAVKRGYSRAERFWLALSVGWLAAGLFLVHVRVFLLYVPWAVIAWLAGRGRATRWLVGAGGVALALIAPRLLELARFSLNAGLFDTSPGYNDFPSGYVTVGWERAFLVLAGLTAVATLLARWRGARWARPSLSLLIWVGLLSLGLAGRRLGLPETWLINVNSLYIALFLPLSILLGIGAQQLWRWWRWRGWLVQTLGYVATGALLAALTLFGVRLQITIINPDTILARPEDMPAIDWADEHLPPQAKVAVNAWRWLGNAWAAQDGGAWLLPLAGLATTTPPVDYMYSLPLFNEVIAFNTAAQQVQDWSSADSAELLRQYHITHVFVGKRGGFFNPAALSRNPVLTTLYDRDGVFIFGLASP